MGTPRCRASEVLPRDVRRILRERRSDGDSPGERPRTQSAGIARLRPDDEVRLRVRVGAPRSEAVPYVCPSESPFDVLLGLRHAPLNRGDARAGGERGVLERASSRRRAMRDEQTRATPDARPSSAVTCPNAGRTIGQRVIPPQPPPHRAQSAAPSPRPAPFTAATTNDTAYTPPRSAIWMSGTKCVLRVAEEVPAEADHLVEAERLQEREAGREVHPHVFERDPHDRHRERERHAEPVEPADESEREHPEQRQHERERRATTGTSSGARRGPTCVASAQKTNPPT